jgi:hypothetical protein
MKVKEAKASHNKENVLEEKKIKFDKEGVERSLEKKIFKSLNNLNEHQMNELTTNLNVFNKMSENKQRSFIKAINKRFLQAI